MNASELAAVLFSVTNTARLFAYLPQIVTLWRDETGARAVSCLTWILFAVSNAATLAYATLVLDDLRMAAVFAANTICCVVVLALIIVQRARHLRFKTKYKVL